jgi:hypothetical protein
MRLNSWKLKQGWQSDWKKGDDLFRNAVQPLQGIVRSLGNEYPESTVLLQNSMDILWTKSLQLTDEDQSLKDEYLAGEHDG